MSSPLPDRSPISPHALNLQELLALPEGTELTFFCATGRPQRQDVRFVRVDDDWIYYITEGSETSRYLTDAGIVPYDDDAACLYVGWNEINCTVLRKYRDRPFHPQAPEASDPGLIAPLEIEDYRY